MQQYCIFFNSKVFLWFEWFDFQGGFGYDFSSNVDQLEVALQNVAKGILAHGVTSFCPTLVTSASKVYKKVWNMSFHERYAFYKDQSIATILIFSQSNHSLLLLLVSALVGYKPFPHASNPLLSCPLLNITISHQVFPLFLLTCSWYSFANFGAQFVNLLIHLFVSLPCHVVSNELQFLFKEIYYKECIWHLLLQEVVQSLLIMPSFS